jgi:hypothetical protein
MLQQILHCCSKQLSESNYTLAEIPDVSAWSTKGYRVYWKLWLPFDTLKFFSFIYSLMLNLCQAVSPYSTLVFVYSPQVETYIWSISVGLHWALAQLSLRRVWNGQTCIHMMWTHFHITLFNPEDGSSIVLWNKRNAAHFQTGSAPKNRINTDRSM